ncbi:FG-GAP-like repeat-containing protein [Candidatus Cyanaurora vandensis]|uniref:FG-GAP-like repeat-containing protein n=1 Tax=Candidatus Cyanaurora vandensis TaxID=2714958 RepID=UPI00257D2769|nr:FG-GAP-like repeat-containing protein [Candidatus Cyanaurora vandensis]
MRFFRLGLCATLFLTAAVHAAPQFAPTGTYDTGLGENGAEIVDVRGNVGVLTNAGNRSVDVLDLTNLRAITLTQRVPLVDTTRTLNSAAIHPTQDFFLVAQGDSSPSVIGATGTVSAYRLSDGAFLTSVPAGILPDSIDIAPDGSYAVVANEAEGETIGDNGGAGSLTVIALSGCTATSCVLTETQVPLPSQTGTPGFSTGRTDDAARLAVDNTPGTLEPETVGFSPDSQYALVSLQENNGVVRVRLSDLNLTFFGLGQVNHLADVSTSDGYQPVTPYTQFREPDGVVVTPDGKYFVVANEGDTRNGAASSDIRGGRTLSVFDSNTGAFVGDTGSQLDDIANTRGIYPDSRSNRGGSEPEVLDVTQFAERTLAAVGLERANAVALVDITNPAFPVVVDLGLTGTGPEGVKFVNRGDLLYVLTANEVSGTLTALQVRLEKGDFNLDNSVDLLWRDTTTGENALWFLQGTTLTNGVFVPPVTDLAWEIRGTADFNNDSRADILWRNRTTGENAVWFMDGAVYLGAALLLSVTDPNWQIGGTGDFNGDGGPDLLWRNQATGENAVWFLDGTFYAGAALLPSQPDLGWAIVGAGDFVRDGKTDILWRNQVTGANEVWQMNGVTFVGTFPVPAVTDLTWIIAGSGDFNNDSQPDIFWRNTDGTNAVWQMSGTSYVTALPLDSLGATWQSGGPR